MKIFLIGGLHLFAITHIVFILRKEQQIHFDGLFFVIYVIGMALYWKKFAREKKKYYETKK
jgi:hypothetical protein